VGRRGYPPEFRRKVLDLVESGRSVADVASTPHGVTAWLEQRTHPGWSVLAAAQTTALGQRSNRTG
jgi:transposase-like protein